MTIIRDETPDDIPFIHKVNQKAFGQPNEAELVDALRNSGSLTISLIAIYDDTLAGHIAFSPVTIEPPVPNFKALGLAPMAVLPEYQNRGIGSRLIEAGLEKCACSGYEMVFVLGYPNYYPRFGFIPTKQYGIRYEDDVPDEAFMVKELRDGALKNINGVIKFGPEFEEV